MKLIDILRNKRNKVLELEKEKTNNKTLMDNIKIIIENDTGAFENEEEIIKTNALTFLELGKADSMEDAIITSATMIRGLKYKGTVKDENGNIIITFKDLDLNNSPRR